MKWIVLLMLIYAVVSDALADYLRDKGEKGLSHFFEAISVLSLLVVAFLTPYFVESPLDFFMYVFLMYCVQRLFLFDIVYNIANTNVPIDYIGTTAWSDRLLRKIKMHPSWWLWTRLIIWFAYTFGVMLNY